MQSRKATSWVLYPSELVDCTRMGHELFATRVQIDTAYKAGIITASSTMLF